MPLDVRVADEAERQIDRIAAYSARDSPDAAANWVYRLRLMVDSLNDMPEGHQVVFTREEAGMEVRRTHYGVYNIYYTIGDKEVVVQSVRHGYREPPSSDEVINR